MTRGKTSGESTTRLAALKNPRYYRTYTYSAKGYRELLWQAGFPATEVHWVWPEYSHPRASGMLDGKSVRSVAPILGHLSTERWERLLFGAAARLPEWALNGLVRAFSPYFVIVASRRAVIESPQHSIVTSHPDAVSFARISLSESTQLTTTFLLFSNRGGPSYVRVRETQRASAQTSSFEYEPTDRLDGWPVCPQREMGRQASKPIVKGLGS
jgi:hypothetical protein